MIVVLTPEEMRAADAEAGAARGDISLMRDAGAQLATFIRTHTTTGRIVAFAGPGNNGGDAFAALAELDTRYERICYAAPATTPSAARIDAEARARAAGVAVHALPTTHAEAHAALAGAAWAIDGVFGTGARIPVREEYRAAVQALDRDTVPVLAIDIPSGIDAATGAVDATSVHATATVTIAALKPGLLLEPARERAGAIWLAQIGIDDATLARHAKTFSALDDEAFLALLPARSPTADKRGAGAPLILAGSEQFPGAAVLCARGAARAGAGYVTVATSAPAAPVLRAHLIEQVVVTFAGSVSEAVDDLLDVSRRNGAVGIGPGLSLDDWTGTVIRTFIRNLELPFVLDASALFHMGKHLDILRGKACVITPHAGEFARLSGRGTISPGTRVERLREFVERTGITTVLKGADTLIYDGHTMTINPTGTSVLATAGTGDVLTGMIATLLAQGLTPLDAARAAAYWHGLAGQCASSVRPVGVVAGDIPEVLGDATRRAREFRPGALRCVYA